MVIGSLRHFLLKVGHMPPQCPKSTKKIILEDIHSMQNFLSVFDTLLGVSLFCKRSGFLFNIGQPDFLSKARIKITEGTIGKIV